MFTGRLQKEFFSNLPFWSELYENNKGRNSAFKFD